MVHITAVHRYAYDVLKALMRIPAEETMSMAGRGQSIVKQHQLVTKALEEEIAKWHGFVLDTKSP